MNKAELQKKAEIQFEKLGVGKLYGTSDGQLFLLHSRAQLHAGTKHTIWCFEKGQNVEHPIVDEKRHLSVKELIIILKEAGMATCKALLLAEISGPNRKSAVAAIEKRMEEIVNQNPPSDGDQTQTGSEEVNKEQSETGSEEVNEEQSETGSEEGAEKEVANG